MNQANENFIDLTDDSSSNRHANAQSPPSPQQPPQSLFSNNSSVYPNTSAPPSLVHSSPISSNPFSQPLSAPVINFISPNMQGPPYINQTIQNFPSSSQSTKPNPTDNYLKMFHDTYSQPRILNTHQFLSKHGLNATTTPTFVHPQMTTSQPPNELPVKHRVLPATVTVPSHVPHVPAFQQNLLNRQQIINQHTTTYFRPNTASTQTTASLPQTSPQLQKVQMVFSLINADAFTARVETGSVRVELVRFLSSVQGSTFDHKAKRFVFPLLIHDQLQVRGISFSSFSLF